MSTKATTTTSIPTSEWERCDDGYELAGAGRADNSEYGQKSVTLTVGDRGYLVEDVDTNRGTSRWSLNTSPALTNQSHEPRAEGWLGTTNNVAAYGRGFVEVVHIGPRTIRVRQIPMVEHDGQQMSTDEQLQELATTWRESQTTEESAREALAHAARDAHATGMSAYRISKLTGAASDTVAKWLRS